MSVNVVSIGNSKFLMFGEEEYQMYLKGMKVGIE